MFLTCERISDSYQPERTSSHILVPANSSGLHSLASPRPFPISSRRRFVRPFEARKIAKTLLYVLAWFVVGTVAIFAAGCILIEAGLLF